MNRLHFVPQYMTYNISVFFNHSASLAPKELFKIRYLSSFMLTYKILILNLNSCKECDAPYTVHLDIHKVFIPLLKVSFVIYTLYNDLIPAPINLKKRHEKAFLKHLETLCIFPLLSKLVFYCFMNISSMFLYLNVFLCLKILITLYSYLKNNIFLIKYII